MSSTTPKVVLVTGAATYLGCFLVSQLAQNPTIDRILAVDNRIPSKVMLRRMGRAEFHRVDPRRSGIVKTVADARVDTVVHAATSVMDTAPHSPAIKEFSIVGAMQVFGACQRVPTVQRVILRSSSMVYGSGPKAPARLAERTRTRHEPTGGYGRDLLDVESYARGLVRRRPDISLTVLRTAPILGPQIPTRMGAYLGRPVVPTALGYEPRMQFLHEEDALRALEAAILTGVPGTFNVAADGVMTIPQIVHRLGRLALPVPAPLLGAALAAVSGRGPTLVRNDQVPLLVHGRVLDNTLMRSELRFEPRYTTASTVADFGERSGTEPFIDPATWNKLEQRIGDWVMGTGAAPRIGVAAGRG